MTIELSNGIKIPSIGIGTFLLQPDVAQKSVEAALKDGYRLIDTANAYMNEKAVGRAMKNSGIPRNEIFLSTKLWPTVYEDQDAVEKTLKRLQTDYIDLLFIHQPAGNYMAGYRQIEKAYKEGKVKSIGISNFHDAKLERLLKECEIKPHVIQTECHPYWTQHNLMDTLKPYGTVLMAWYPLGHGDKGLINEQIFNTLAQKYHKSNAQIILKWHIQKGFIVIPGSSNPSHIASNFDIFDFNLTNEEMNQIAHLDDKKRYYIPDDAKEESYAGMKMDFDSQK
ncbi:hypothetical protein M9Y10_043024 [Tritrichomonas musculus]|uniref:NADP-dependent oxidoreductase domain-containing protein n=1 Tax=Tritrichomonas musculus TaxID=1915356 RepID=A0ABR2K0C7_9EUKA